MTAIKHSEVIEEGVFSPTIQEAKALHDSLQLIVNDFKEILKTTQAAAKSNSFENFDDIEKAAKAMNDAKSAADGLAKTEKALAEATKNLKAAQAGEVDEVTRMKLATQAAQAETKRLAKEQINLGNAYDQQSAKLNNLRRAYKDLAVQNKQNSAEAQELLAEITRLDGELKTIDATVGQFQRNVGNYAGAFSNAFEVLNNELRTTSSMRKEVKGFGKDFDDLTKKEAVLTQVTNSLNKEFKTSVQQSRAYQEAARQIGFTFGHNSEIFQKFKDQVGEGVDQINDINDAIKVAASDTATLDRLISAANGIAGGFAVAEGAVALFGDESEDLRKTMVKLQSVLAITNGLQAVQAELRNKDSIATKAQIGLQRLYALAVGNSTGAMKGFRLALLATWVGAIIVALGLLIANFDKIKNALGLGVNPATRQLAEETKKAAEASREALEAFDIEERRLRALGAAELDLIAIRRQRTEENKRALEEDLLAQKRVLNETTAAFVRMKALAASGNAFVTLFGTDQEDVDEVKKQVTEATRAYEEAVAQLAELDKKNNDLIIKQQREVSELRIANMEDGLAKELAKEAESYDQRKEQLKENTEALALLEINYAKNVTKIRQDYHRRRMEEEIKAEQVYQDLLIENMDEGFDKLIAQENNNFQKRKRELAGNYKALEQLEIQHYDRLAEIARERNPVPEVIKSQQKDLKDVQKNLLKTQEDALKKSQEGVTKTLEENAQRQEAALRRAQRQAQRLADTAEEANKIADRRSQKRQQELDKEMEASKKRADELRQLAIQGDKNAQDSIAAEEKRQAEIERRREKEKAKERRRQLALTAINTYNSKVQAGDPNALGSTIRDLTLLGAAIAAIPGFYEGTENIADALGKPNLPGKDGYIVRVDGDERVLNPSQNAMVGDLSNEELAEIANLYTKGLLLPYGGGVAMGGITDTSRIEEKLDRMIEAVTNMPVPVTHWDGIIEGIRETTTARNNNRIRKYRA